ncbi:MAG: GAF domain-containing sensor histidine kinase [Ardenticatenaceae bacterium]|nr:GAF domain-containing sensor histidine kinase [Ardenticatenaceae bacterium]
METRSRRMSETIAILRWAVPVLIAILGPGYTLFEHLVFEQSGLSPHMMREVIFLGLTGPLLAWLTLTWAREAAFSREVTEKELAERNRQLASLNNISAAVSRSLDLQEVLDEALARLADLLHVDAGAIRILKGSTLFLQSHQGLSSDFVNHDRLVTLGECLCGLAAHHRRPFVANDLGATPLLTRNLCAAEGLFSILCAPVTSQTKVVGIVHVGSRQPRSFSPQDGEFLVTIGHQIGMAVENAGLYAEVKALNQELEARVEERTAELDRARQEIARKAQQLQKLLAKTVQIQEQERARIAQDMHNGVIQLVVGALYEVQAAKNAAASDPVRLRERLETALDLLQQVEAETRRTIYDLCPPVLDAKGLVPALRQYVARYQELTGVPCTLHVAGTLSRLPAEVEVATYRVVQEALHNVQGHAQATAAEVLVRFGGEGLWLMIRDNGRGFDPGAVEHHAERHLGLMGMRERIQSIGGHLEIEAAPGQGTCIVIRVAARPLESDALRGAPAGEDHQ